MRRIVLLTMFTGVLMLTGCLSDGGSASATSNVDGSDSTLTPAQRIAQLEASGAIPMLDRSTDPVGPDSNMNGARDDVEAYINANYAAGAEVKAASQFARALQAAIAVDPAMTDSVKAISLDISRAVNCVYSSFGSNTTTRPGMVVEEVRSITTNTRERLKAYLAFSKALDGSSSALPSGDTCE